MTKVRGKPISSMMSMLVNANGELRSAATANGQVGSGQSENVLKSSVGGERLALTQELTQA